MSVASPGIDEQIQRHLDDIPPLSPTVTKVLQIVNDPDAAARDLLQVIKLDPVLTARVLRLINSPFFGMSGVTAINRALVAVGFNTVKNLVLSSALAGLLASGTDPFSEQLWSHSLSVGVAARVLARGAGRSREEQEAAFICGLMHDLGKVLIHKHFRAELRQIQALEAQGVPLVEAEMRLLGTDHERIGGMLGRKWLFPVTLVAGVERHHSPFYEGVGAFESCLTCIANALYYRLQLDGRSAVALPEIPLRAWRIVGLEEALAIDLLGTVHEEVESARAFLGG